jgi:ribosome-binding protein aMBF1 (putative translation factor)
MKYARASLARLSIIQRHARGWSQATLARNARVKLEVIRELESAKGSAGMKALKRIESALGRRPMS